jgi:stage V sporulation protein S
MESDNSLIKVSAKSPPPSVAGAIAKTIREKMHAEVQAIGAGAVNQAVKAIAIAEDYLVQDKTKIYCVPRFIDTEIDGKERTAIRFSVVGYPDDKKEGSQTPPS